MNDKHADFLEQLATPPLKHNGFNDELRRRIEARIDQPPKPSRAWVPYATGLCIALLFIILFMPEMPLWEKGSQEYMQYEANHPMQIHDAGSEAFRSTSDHNALASQSATTDSALLIAFRSDSTEGAQDQSSSYRTMLISHENGEIELTAQGDTLIVPFGQQFWEISPVVFDRNVYLWAHPAQTTNLEADVHADQQSIHREKVLYAGNQYVSTAVTIESARQQADSFWVKELPSLNPALGSENEITLSHVTLQEIFDNRISGDQWRITRHPGKWLAQSISRTDGTFQDVPIALPDSVVSSDLMNVPWSHIEAIAPDAIDAIASPSEDMIAIITDHHLQVYVMQDGHVLRDVKLEERLATNEQLVMNEWAVGKYVPIWKETLSELLNR